MQNENLHSIQILFVSLLFALSFAQQHDFAVYTLTQGTPNQVTVIAGNVTGEVKVVNKVNTGGNGVPTGTLLNFPPSIFPSSSIFSFLFSIFVVLLR